MWLMLWQRPPSKFMSLLRAIGAHKRKSSLHNLTISPLSHPLSLQTPNKRWNNDGKFWGEKRLGFEKKPACVWVEGGGYKLAAKLCHKASQSPPAAKPLLTRLSNFRPSFRPARLSMAIPKKSHFEQKVGIVANLLYPNPLHDGCPKTPILHFFNIVQKGVGSNPRSNLLSYFVKAFDMKLT